MRVMNRLKKRIPVFLCVLCVLCGESQLRAQKHLVLDLNRTISLANDSSLESFRTQNMYLSGYWEYRTFRANRLPSLTLDVTPAQYNRDITKRYDSGQDLETILLLSSISLFFSNLQIYFMAIGNGFVTCYLLHLASN